MLAVRAARTGIAPCAAVTCAQSPAREWLATRPK